jgi:hypothetical protein
MSFELYFGNLKETLFQLTEFYNVTGDIHKESIASLFDSETLVENEETKFDTKRWHQHLADNHIDIHKLTPLELSEFNTTADRDKIDYNLELLLNCHIENYGIITIPSTDVPYPFSQIDGKITIRENSQISSQIILYTADDYFTQKGRQKSKFVRGLNKVIDGNTKTHIITPSQYDARLGIDSLGIADTIIRGYPSWYQLHIFEGEQGTKEIQANSLEALYNLIQRQKYIVESLLKGSSRNIPLGRSLIKLSFEATPPKFEYDYE